MYGVTRNRGGRIRVRSMQDVLCGLFFMAVGVFGLWVGRDYPMGTAVRLGTGVFPVILCWGMVVSGVIILVRGLVVKGEPIGHIAWRPVILISAAATAFALLIDPAGLVVAMLALMVLSGFAGHEFHPKEYAIFTAIMIPVGVAMFVWGLGMPIKVFPWN